MGLKFRLMLAFSVVLALVMLTGTVYFIRGARDDVRIELQSTMQLTAHFLDAELAALNVANTGQGSIPFNLDRLARIRHLKVEFFDRHGQLMESNRPPGGNQLQPPPAWFLALAAPSPGTLQTLRWPVSLGGEARGELLVSPDPSNEIGEIWQDTKELMQLSLLLFVSVNAVMYFVLSRALRPVVRILGALNEMREGNLRTRLPRFALPELTQIGDQFNRMADALEQSSRQNHRLTRQLIHVQADEPRRLARELHDELGQYLSAVHADAIAILRHGESRYPPVRDSAAAIADVSRRIMATVRAMLQRLRPDTLDALGLAEALRQLANSWQQRHPEVICTLHLHGDLNSLGEDINITLYRIVQESLTNVTRHARAQHVDIRLARDCAADGDSVEVEVCDDGAGSDAVDPDRGFGLLGMRERVASLDGEFLVVTSPGRGYQVCVTLPVAMPAVDA
jgi:two-component system sensor histidine kinase UhpB